MRALCAADVARPVVTLELLDLPGREAAEKLVGSGLCDVVDLRRSIAPLIDSIRMRIDRHFGYRIQYKDEVGREFAVQIGQRVVCFQAIDNATVRESGEAIEHNVAEPIRAANKIIAAACRIDEHACGKLKGIS